MGRGLKVAHRAIWQPPKVLATEAKDLSPRRRTFGVTQPAKPTL